MLATEQVDRNLHEANALANRGMGLVLRLVLLRQRAERTKPGTMPRLEAKHAERETHDALMTTAEEWLRAVAVGSEE